MAAFGIFLPVYGSRFPIGTVGPDFQTLRKMVEVAEELGFDSVWIPDHIMNPTGSTAKVMRREYFPLPSLESWTTLSGLSQATEKIRLSNIVICNLFRHPSLLAKMSSTLDIISKGRLILSMGAGWFKEECLAYGLPWYPYRERVERLREALKVIKTLWTQRVASFSGSYYKIKDAYLEPKPIQKPHPPIWIGGASENMMKVAAEEADGWDAGAGSPAELIDKKISLKEYCSRIKRNSTPVSITHSCSLIHEDNFEKALERVRPMVDLLGMMPEKFASRHLLGTYSDMVSQVEKFFKAGADRLNIGFEPDVEEVRSFGKEVLPSFI